MAPTSNKSLKNLTILSLKAAGLKEWRATKPSTSSLLHLNTCMRHLIVGRKEDVPENFGGKLYKGPEAYAFLLRVLLGLENHKYMGDELIVSQIKNNFEKNKNLIPRDMKEIFELAFQDASSIKNSVLGPTPRMNNMNDSIRAHLKKNGANNKVLVCMKQGDWWEMLRVTCIKGSEKVSMIHGNMEEEHKPNIIDHVADWSNFKGTLSFETPAVNLKDFNVLIFRDTEMNPQILASLQDAYEKNGLRDKLVFLLNGPSDKFPFDALHAEGRLITGEQLTREFEEAKANRVLLFEEAGVACEIATLARELVGTKAYDKELKMSSPAEAQAAMEQRLLKKEACKNQRQLLPV